MWWLTSQLSLLHSSNNIIKTICIVLLHFTDERLSKVCLQHVINKSLIIYMLSSFYDDNGRYSVQVDYNCFLPNESTIFSNGSTALLHRNWKLWVTFVTWMFCAIRLCLCSNEQFPNQECMLSSYHTHNTIYGNYTYDLPIKWRSSTNKSTPVTF